MARKPADPDPQQLELIDVDDPAYKAVKKQLTEYESLKDANKEQHAADRQAEKAKRSKVFEAVQAAGIKPDADGAYHVKFGGKEWVFSQDSQLKIKKHSIKEDDAGDGDEDDAPEV